MFMVDLFHCCSPSCFLYRDETKVRSRATLIDRTAPNGQCQGGWVDLQVPPVAPPRDSAQQSSRYCCRRAIGQCCFYIGAVQFKLFASSHGGGRALEGSRQECLSQPLATATASQSNQSCLWSLVDSKSALDCRVAIHQEHVGLQYRQVFSRVDVP